MIDKIQVVPDEEFRQITGQQTQQPAFKAAGGALQRAIQAAANAPKAVNSGQQPVQKAGTMPVQKGSGGVNLGMSPMSTAIDNFRANHEMGYTPFEVGTPTLARQQYDENIRQYDTTMAENQRQFDLANQLDYAQLAETARANDIKNVSTGNQVNQAGYNLNKMDKGAKTDAAMQEAAKIYDGYKNTPVDITDAHSNDLGSLGSIVNEFNPTVSSTSEDPLLYTLHSIVVEDGLSDPGMGLGSDWDKKKVIEYTLHQNGYNLVTDYIAALEAKKDSRYAQELAASLHQLYD